MRYLYNTFIYEPLYNGLIFLADVLPFLDAGVIIVLFTIIVKLVLFPLSKKAVRTQVVMRLMEPEMKAIKEKYKDDRQMQAVKMMALYKEKQINPFSSIFLLLIQLPIIFALYSIFYRTGFTSINADILYSFVPVPETVNLMFLGLVDVTQRSIPLAILAAVSQFFQIKFSVPKPPEKTEKGGFQEDFARSMHMQMKYVLPVVILFIAYYATGALAIYWTTSNIFMIGQEIVIRRQLAKENGSKRSGSGDDKDNTKKN